MSRPPVDYIARTRALYSAEGFPEYRWVYNPGAPPFEVPAKPLSECRVGLVASGGIYVAGQRAFHYRDDASARIVDTATPVADLRIAHFAYDTEDAMADPNVVFPLDPLRRLVDGGFIGELAARAYTFMGGIYSARRVRERLAPEITRRLHDDEVDVALLVPV